MTKSTAALVVSLIACGIAITQAAGLLNLPNLDEKLGTEAEIALYVAGLLVGLGVGWKLGAFRRRR